MMKNLFCRVVVIIMSKNHRHRTKHHHHHQMARKPCAICGRQPRGARQCVVCRRWTRPGCGHLPVCIDCPIPPPPPPPPPPQLDPETESAWGQSREQTEMKSVSCLLLIQAALPELDRPLPCLAMSAVLNCLLPHFAMLNRLLLLSAAKRMHLQKLPTATQAVLHGLPWSEEVPQNGQFQRPLIRWKCQRISKRMYDRCHSHSQSMRGSWGRIIQRDSIWATENLKYVIALQKD